MLVFSEFCECPSIFYDYARKNGLLTTVLGEADFLLLPFPYEYIFDYRPDELQRRGIHHNNLPGLRNMAERLDDLSGKTGKPLLVSFYRDPSAALPFQNALLFRTSALNSRRQKGEFGLPAFLEELSEDPGFQPREKPQRTRVSFRGNMAPLNPAFSFHIRQLYNSSLGRVFPATKQKIWYNEGYLMRRQAVRSLLKKKDQLELDLRINPATNSSDYTASYHRTFFEYDYFLAVAGHGNYSYRLYEAMRAGRIPVFIDTDCLLPCFDVIDWKKLLIWIDRSNASRTAEILLDFHTGIHPDDFLALQQQIRQTWERYLSMDGFARYLFYQALPAQLSTT